MVQTEISALKKQRKKGYEFKTNLGYTEEFYLERKIKQTGGKDGETNDNKRKTL